MKKNFLWLILLFVFAVPSSAQNINAAGSTCQVGGACVQQTVAQAQGGGTISLTGTFSATLQFEATNAVNPLDPANSSYWVAISVTPLGSSTAVTSATATGTWQVNVAGLTGIRVRCSAYTSGTAAVTINLSQASARTNGGGSGGSGTVTSVATTGPITGGTFTTSGTIACATCVTSSSPGAGIAHFAGSTQAVTSSAVALGSDVSGQLPISAVGSAGLSATAPANIASTGVISLTTSGSGNVCLQTSCVMTTPNLGTPSAAVLTNATGLPAASVVAGTLPTGVAAVTQSPGDNTTDVATDAFVLANAGAAPNVNITNPWFVGYGATAAGFSGAGTTYGTGFVAQVSGVYGHFVVDVGTADNGADTYNVGIYVVCTGANTPVSGCVSSDIYLLCSTGAVAGSTQFPSTGVKQLPFTGNCTLTAGTTYYFATNGIAAATAKINGPASNGSTVTPFANASISAGNMGAVGTVLAAPTVSYAATTTSNVIWFALYP